MNLNRSLRPLAAALMAFVFASPALAGPKMEIAVQDDAYFVSRPRGDGLRALAFQRAAELGATHIRVNAWWKRNLDGRIDEDFSALDSFVNEAKERGFVVQMTVGAIAADWGSPDFTKVAPAGVTPKLPEFLDFLAKVVGHFKGRVPRFAIYNEPNHPGFLLAGPAPAVEKYRQLRRKAEAEPDEAKKKKISREASKIFHRQIFKENVKWVRQLWHQGVAVVRAADPSAEVLVGELSSFHTLSFLDKILGHSKKLVADGIAIHPYQYRTRPESTRGLPTSSGGIANAKKVQRTLAHLAKAGRFVNRKGKAVPLFFTEFGYHKLEGRTISQPDRQIPESRRAAWTPRAFEMAKKARARQMLYYHLFATWSGHAWDTSIMSSEGVTNASFHALKDWVARQK